MASNSLSTKTRRERVELESSPYARNDLTRLLGRPPPQNTAQSLPFSDLVGVFNILDSYSTFANNNNWYGDRRRKVISEFLDNWRDKVGPDVFPAARLLMPSLDVGRRIQIMETSLAKMMCEIEGIPPKGQDYKDLHRWRLANVGEDPARDFAEFCTRVMVKRSPKPNAKGMLIDNINNHLDVLAGNDTEAKKESIWTVYLALPPGEFTWFTRIVLGEMYFNIRMYDFWRACHKNASDLFQVTSSLWFVCMAPDSGKGGKVDASHLTLGFNKCFRPQLADGPVKSPTVDGFLQLSIDRLKVGEVEAERFPTLTIKNYFFIEEKLDGERIQVHMRRVVGGGIVFKWWSRKGFDRTSLYGSHIPDTEEAAAGGFTITRHLGGLIDRKGPFSVVLDGEVVAWDPSAERVLPFGSLMKCAREQEREPSDTKPWPKFCAFDVLQVDFSAHAEDGQEGKDKRGESLYVRRRELEGLLRYVPHHFEVVPAVEGSSLADLQREFDRAMLEGGEGLVLKNPYSQYKPGQRARDWVKVKPNKIAELKGKPFKCVVVGANWGKGKNAGRMSSYLCAVAKDGGGEDFVTCIKVPCNDRTQQRRIASATDGKWTNWNPADPPAFLTLGRGSHEKTDRWIRPSDSVLVSVSCSEVCRSNLFPTSMAMRFPFLEDVHPYEAWDSGLTLTGFMNHIASGPAHMSRSL